ncbi:sugar epimerase [Leptolyngbya sp. NIES-3755]|nr:sugar epimerase [Leptolyngbya sp. NIES-3755]
MKAFVTGGTGFVGANLVRLLLEQDWEVRCLVRPNSRLENLQGLAVEIVQGDLTDEQLPELMQGCQILFHVAAHYSLWQRDRDLLYQSNVIGTRNVLAAAKKAGIERSIYTSSVAAIGIDPSGEPTTEDYQSPVEKLIGHYKQSKYWAEQEAIKAIQSGQDVVIVNPSTPIGAYDIKPTPTGDIVLRFLERRMPSYVETGLNFVHVRDVAVGHLLAFQKGKTGERYILGNQNLSLKQLLDELSQITGLSAPARSVPMWLPLSVAWIDEQILTKFGKTPSIPVDGVRMSKQPMYYNPRKAIDELGLPQTPIRIALKDAVNWFQENLSIKTK